MKRLSMLLGFILVCAGLFQILMLFLFQTMNGPNDQVSTLTMMIRMITNSEFPIAVLTLIAGLWIGSYTPNPSPRSGDAGSSGGNAMNDSDSKRPDQIHLPSDLS